MFLIYSFRRSIQASTINDPTTEIDNALYLDYLQDNGLTDSYKLQLGESVVGVRYTPGHTNEHVVYIVDDMVFTGDTLLISGTGRTDF